MPSNSTTPIIFISYAHKDDPFKPAGGEVDWLEYVLEFLRPGETAGRYTVWVDLTMMGSANWEPEIEQKLRACDIFILLVSRRSMASKYILNKELPIVRERDARGEPIRIYPVLLTPTPMVGLDNVRDKNIRPRDATPLSGFSGHDRDAQMSKIADEIAKLADAIAASGGPPAGGVSSDTPERASPGQLLVDIGHLPETPYKSLIGRDTELPDSTRYGWIATSTFSRLSPRAARASRRWSTNGSRGCEPRTIAAPIACLATRSTARA